MFLSLLAVLVFIAFSHGQQVHFGKCKNITTQTNFDVERYAGSWYDIEKFFFAGQMNKRCVVAEYTLRADGKIDVINQDITQNNQVENTTGIAYYTDQDVKSKLTVQLGTSPKAPYWIVETDYDNYSLVWSCIELIGEATAEFSWILSRKRTLDQDSISSLKKRLESYGISTNGFYKTNQENCDK